MGITVDSFNGTTLFTDAVVMKPIVVLARFSLNIIIVCLFLNGENLP